MPAQFPRPLLAPTFMALGLQPRAAHMRGVTPSGVRDSMSSCGGEGEGEGQHGK